MYRAVKSRRSRAQNTPRVTARSARLQHPGGNFARETNLAAPFYFLLPGFAGILTVNYFLPPLIDQ